MKTFERPEMQNLTSWANPGGEEITPPPFVWMAAEPENVQNPASYIERGGVINNSSDVSINHP